MHAKELMNWTSNYLSIPDVPEQVYEPLFLALYTHTHIHMH